MTTPAPAAVRGETRVAMPLYWRLDGAGTDAEAPLVVALHGQGMDEDRFAVVLQKLLPLPYRFLLPRAPWPFEVRAEQRIGWSWYAYDGNQERFRAELARTEQMLLHVLRDAEAAHGLRPRRRVLVGFSQGGYCGAVIALRHPELFHGLVVSGARVKTEMLGGEIQQAGRDRFPVLLCHGLRDVHVLHEAAESSRDVLAAAGLAVQLETFDAGHSIGRAQVAAIAAWLAEVFRTHEAPPSVDAPAGAGGPR